MILTYKNFILKLNSEPIVINNLQLTESAGLAPNARMDKSYIHEYAPEGLASSLRITYYLTGSDPLKRYITNERQMITGDICGLFFETGYLKNHSLRK